MKSVEYDEVRQAVRQRYGQEAASSGGGCECGSSCCNASERSTGSISHVLGYSMDDITSVPEGADMGLGCGNPKAIAALKDGEVVLDLGSGAGFDCFLAARQVGITGRVIGVDMTPEMITRARKNTRKGDYPNVEFRLGEIEHLPVEDDTIDVIISNCVVNLSPDKRQVFSEAFRTLKPGGRLAISDVIAFTEIPDEARKDMALYTGCIAGAATVSEVTEMLLEAGFREVLVEPKSESSSFIREWVSGSDVSNHVVSAIIQARKP